MSVLGVIPGVGFEPHSRAACLGRDLIVTAVVTLALGAAGLAVAASLPQMQLLFSNPLLITTSITSILAGGYLVTQSVLSCCLKKRIATLFEKIRECVKKIGFFIGALFLFFGVTALASPFIPQLAPYLFTTRMIAAGVTAFTALLFLGLEWRFCTKASFVENKRKEHSFAPILQKMFIRSGQEKLAPYKDKLRQLPLKKEEAFWKRFVGRSVEEHFSIPTGQIDRAKKGEETYEECAFFLVKKIEAIVDEGASDSVEAREKVTYLGNYLYNCCILLNRELSVSEHSELTYSTRITPALKDFSEKIVKEMYLNIYPSSYTNT